jgi:hypothetical protein
MTAAMAGLLYMAVCSPKTMTFPSMDTMNIGAIGNETFLSMALSYRTRRLRVRWLSCWWKGFVDKPLSNAMLKWVRDTSRADFFHRTRSVAIQRTFHRDRARSRDIPGTIM